MNARTLSMSDFHSRKKANEGKKVYLQTPDGTVTEHYLVIVNCDSDALAKAHAEARTAAVEHKMSGATDSEFTQKQRMKLIASAVIGWSFEDELTKESVTAFLTECPHIADEVDNLIYDRKAFFGGAV